MSVRRRIAVIAVTARGARIAAEIAATCAIDAEIHVPERWLGEAPGATIMADGARAAVAAAWGRMDAIVGVMAAGALVRLIAPHLSEKAVDPAVVAVDDGAAHAICIAGGHAALGNELAGTIADALGANAIVTTASDIAGAPAIDTLDRQFGWRRATSDSQLRVVLAAVANREPVAIFQDCGDEGWLHRIPSHWRRAESFEELRDTNLPAVVITARDVPPREATVVFHPPVLAIGVGCSTGAPADEVAELVERTLAGEGLSARAVAHIATIDRRADEPAIIQLGHRLGVPIVTYAADALASVTCIPTPSAVVATHVGTPGVCEPAAILASGGGTLVVAKQKSAHCTVAIAMRASTHAGSLVVAGLGPGDPDHMTAAVRRAIRDADVVIGYRGYLEQIAAWVPPNRRRAFDLGEEQQRVAAAITAAESGQRVVLVSSGDAGIYATAGLVFERMESRPRCTPFDIRVEPGITAASAAGALLGAPLMLDFAAISLSDLLVPWVEIERRLRAAADADFVLALYNPASSRRQWQFNHALDIIRGSRPPSTPVGIVTRAYRPGQVVDILELADVDVAQVGMQTTLIVGNSRTRIAAGRLVTSRGYDLATVASRTTPNGTVT